MHNNGNGNCTRIVSEITRAQIPSSGRINPVETNGREMGEKELGFARLEPVVFVYKTTVPLVHPCVSLVLDLFL